MQTLTAEWVDKAEGDFATLLREVRARKQPNYDSACFHAQQCAEKYLKAQLQESGIPFAKTHDLPSLLQLLSSIEPSWTTLLPELRLLNLYSVVFRYPGQSADKLMAREALRACTAVRDVARRSLGLVP
jgi:HEPN domain-containing protein